MKYPGGVKIDNHNFKQEINYGNRGMNLEDDINNTNQYYIDTKKAYIYKKPTPIQITKSEYTKNGIVIKEAFFKEPSTTDYNGLYDGKYIDFEAKETNNKTSFPLANIHKHQIKHIKNVIENKGVGFLIVRFNKLSKTFLLLGEDFINFVDKEERKSIPISYFDKNAYIINSGFSPRLDYLKVIDSILGGTKNEK